MFLISLLGLCLSFTPIQVKRLDLASTLSAFSNRWTFVLAADSSDFEFVTLIKTFKTAAHLSLIPAEFIILDVSREPVDPNSLNITRFPCLIFTRDGEVTRALYRGFDEENLLSFFTSCAVCAPKVLETKEALNTFLSASGVSLLAAFDGASAETFPEIASFYYDHYSDVVVGFVSPSLLDGEFNGQEGYYLYRFADSVMVRLPDLSGKSSVEIATEIAKNLMPEFPKLNAIVAGYYEELKSRFVILMLVMEDFYMTSQQLELAREIKQRTGLNVTYADVENSQTLSLSYGLPDSLDSTMAVIDHSGKKTTKFMLTESLNIENAVRLIKAVEDGSASPYYKSEAEGHSSKIGCQIQSISAKSLVQLVKDKKSVALALYISSHDPMEHYVNATNAVKVERKDVTYGKFSLNTNDWPLEEYDETIDYPILCLIKNGKIIYTGTLANTTESVVLQLNDGFDKNAEL